MQIDFEEEIAFSASCCGSRIPYAPTRNSSIEFTSRKSSSKLSFIEIGNAIFILRDLANSKRERVSGGNR